MGLRNPLPETKFNRLLVSGIIILMLALGSALTIVMRQDPSANGTWRIAITYWPGFDYLYLAQQKGFLAEQGLNITLIPINSTTDIRTAYERGSLDGYTSSIMDVVESIQDTRTPARIVLMTDYSNGSDELLADPSITTLPELRGKRIGVEITSSIGRYMLQRTLDNANLTPADIDIRPLGQSIIVDQAPRGNLDALITYEPFASDILAKRHMNILFSSATIPEEILDVLAVTPAMLEAEPNLSRRLQNAWQNALDYAEAHPEETTQIFARRYGVTPETYTRMTSGVRILSRTDMQRYTSLHELHQTIWRVAKLLRPEIPLPNDEISRTVALWYQKEALR